LVDISIRYGRFGEGPTSVLIHILAFGHPNSGLRGVDLGTINRLTGETHIGFQDVGSFQVFTGTCKPAQRLF
jgi:hypothetical protein